MSKTPPSRLFFALIAVVLVFVIGRNLYHRTLNNALVDAVEAKNAVEVRSLLSRGADAKAKTSRVGSRDMGTPVLSMAIDNLRGLVTNSSGVTAPEEVVCLLIEHGAYIHNSPGDLTYLEAAAGCGSVSVVRCLLEHGTNPNIADNNRETALDVAFTYGSAGYGYSAAGVRTASPDAARRTRVSREIAALLRQHGARFTPLQAVQSKDVSLLTQTLQASANANESGRNVGAALYEAAKQGSLPIMQILLAHGANVNAYARFDGVPLDAAASEGNLDAVKLLLARGANINVAGREEASPLVNAITAQHTDIARLLLARGADPNLKRTADDYGGASLTTAAANLPALVPDLLAHHADINEGDGAPLKAALRAHNADLVRYLLGQGAKIYPAISRSLVTPPGRGAGAKPQLTFVVTPSTLQTAATYNPECFEILMHAGATLGNDKADILLAAASAGHAVLFDRLIALDANVNATTSAGGTPLTEALKYAQAGVPTLLEHGANPNVVTMGMTPLLIVVQAGNTSLMRLLLAHGADVNAKPPRGHTPLYYARRHKNADIIRMLEQAGAKEE